MRCLLPAAALPLRGRMLALPPTIIEADEPANFDLVDLRADLATARITPVSEVQPRTIFRLKHHVGIGGGYDNGVIHGSIGFYMTVAEWGKWTGT